MPRFNEVIAADLLAAGYDVSIAQPYDPDYGARMGECSDARRYYLERDPYDDIKAFAGDKRLVSKLFLEIGPDLIVFSNGIHPIASAAGMQAALFFAIPYVVVDGLIAHTLFQWDATTTTVVSELYQNAAAAIVKSQENLENLRDYLSLPEAVGMSILSGRTEDFFEPVDPSNRAKIRYELNIPEDAVVSFSAAKFEPIKGYQYQIEAMRILKDQDVWDRLYFVWAGDGMDLESIANMLSELGLSSHVRLLGHRTDIASLLDAADCFVLTSRAEAAPLSIMEAMAKGVPVIGTAIGGIPEAIQDAGTLVASPQHPAQTVRELTDALASHVSGADLRRRNGLAGQKRARTAFRLKRMTDTYRGVFEKALASKNRKMDRGGGSGV